ncbi:DUF1211 domain-containing protein [bacterium]|nr:DUF1211 domain-containing protein [bacterium]
MAMIEKTGVLEGIGKGRIETLSDGIFAIAMTLLVLQLQVPDLREGQLDQLGPRLVDLAPKFSAYVISFMSCGVYWVAHHLQLNYVYRSDRIFMWTNICFLMVISAIPFSAALIGEYHEESLAIRFYCGNLMLAGLVLFGQMRYAAGPGRLIDREISSQFLRLANRRALLGPLIYACAAISAGHSHLLSHALCALAPILYILPGRIDYYWKEDAKRTYSGN